MNLPSDRISDNPDDGFAEVLLNAGIDINDPRPG